MSEGETVSAGGTASAGKTVPPYVAAVRVFDGWRPANRGGGLLIDARHVLTCAHLVADIDKDNAAIPLRRGFDEPVASGLSVAQRAGVAIEVLAGFGRSFETDWRRASYVDEDLGNDLALLRLDRPARGVVPPTIGAGAPRASARFAFGLQGTAFEGSDIEGGGGIRRTVEGESAPQSTGHAHGLPAGYSGGPMIVLDAEGRHWLEGISIFGGLSSPVGGTAGVGAVTAFLARALPGWAAPPPPDEGLPLPPGIAPEIRLGEGASWRFPVWRSQGVPLFRAARPLSAAEEAGLRGVAERRIGADRLPAHLPDAAAVRACLAALAAAHGPGLRLPTPAELAAMAESEATAGRPPRPGVPPGGLPLLSPTWDEASAATPVGTAEWTQEGSVVRCLLRRRSDGPLELLTPGTEAAASPHLRHALRLLFEPS